MDLGPGLDPEPLAALQKRSQWQQCRQALGLLGRDVDLVVQDQADAERLAGSRWHVMGDVAREGRVLFVAG